jgi:starch synthase (maltosyl-transferring)
LRFAQVDDPEVIGYVKESVANDNAVAVAVTLAKHGPQEFWFHSGHRDRACRFAPPGQIHRKLGHRQRHTIEWGGVRLQIDQERDPALIFRCFA